MASFARRSLKTQIAVAAAVLVALLAFVIQEVVGRTAAARMERAVGQRLAATARQAAETLEREMWVRAKEVALLTALDVFRPPFDRAGIGGLLDRLQLEMPAFTWVGFLDHRGTVVAATGGLLEGRDISARPVYSAGIRGGFIGDVHEAKLLASLLPAGGDGPMEFVDIAAPVYADDAPVGVLAAHLSWEWARETERSLLGPVSGERGVDLFVIGRDGAVLLGPGRAAGDRAPGLASVTAAATGRGGWVAERWPDGRDYLTGYALGQGHRDYRGLGWTVLARQPVEIAMAPAATLRSAILWTAAALALLAAWLAWLGAGRLVAPLRRMSTAADRVRAGDAEQIPDVGGSREVASLAQSLRYLIDSLRHKDVALGAMSHLAHHDALTGLANRVALAAHLERAVAQARREGTGLGFVCLDLDGFKPINDAHGHAAGDAVLRAVAARLAASVRGGDVVARLGGDEFMIVVVSPRGDMAEARRVAERVLEALRRPIPVDGRELRVGCSIGIGLWPADGEAVEDVVQRADAALYTAKERGRNRIETTAALDGAAG